MFPNCADPLEMLPGCINDKELAEDGVAGSCAVDGAADDLLAAVTAASPRMA